MKKISIGAPTYNDGERIKDLFTTLVTFTQPEDYSLIMLDDGTPEKKNHVEMVSISQEFDIPLIENKENRGIPYSWNRLTEHYSDTDYMVLFNDDIQICSSEWLKNIVYFLDNNEKAGAVGVPLIHIDPNTGQRNKDLSLPDETGHPGRVGSAVGCAFAFRKSLWDEVKQPDGSTGFWEALVSFYEELDFGFELAKRGYSSYMLPTPACEHWGSRTFASNKELSVRQIIDYIPKDEYLEILKEGQDKMALPLSEHIEQASRGMAYRMDYSRVMFAKKWGCSDKWNVPQVEAHTKYVDVLPKENVKWIDKEGKEREAIV